MKGNILVPAFAAVGAMLASSPSLADTSIGLRVGTLGAGVELAHAFTETFGFRVSANSFNYSTSDSYQDIDYDSKLKLKTGQLLLDWFPFANNFRVSAGGVYNGNKLALDGKPSPGGTYTINGTTYSSSSIDSLNGDVDFRKAAPYLGLGYGRPVGKGLAFIADLGVLFQGAPRSTLTATCSATTLPTTCAQIRSDVAVEQDRLNDDLHKYQYYPVVSIGLAYVF